MRLLQWALRALLFFTLFAFALNNQQMATIHWFFGVEWSAPMVFVVLAAFAVGCTTGILSMVPAWWRHRRVARQNRPLEEPATQTGKAAPAPAERDHPPRDGL